MTGRLIFLVEEPSMKALLDSLLPRLFPGWIAGQDFLCVPHEGKSDLDRSVPIKLRAWREPGVRFVIVRDNDNDDCLALKSRLTQVCKTCNRPDTLIRLVCQELKSWYIGDPAALARAFNDQKLNTQTLRQRFAEPDTWQKPASELRRLIPSFQKIGSARLMAKHLDAANNRSPSFQVFVNGVSRVVQEMEDYGSNNRFVS